MTFPGDHLMLNRFCQYSSLLFLIASLACAASAQKAKPANVSKVPLPQIKYEKIKLKNGLDVILYEDHRLPLVAVNLWYHVGPANERPGLTGFAHLFEHMMFQGSQHVGPKAHFRYLEGAGASDINGTTEPDRTNYFETLPSNQLELALWLESDRMGYLLETLDREKLANQRDVVRNERRQGVENEPYGLVEEQLYHQLFPKNHPYYADVIGSHEDIEAARLNDVRQFFRQYYTPNNASLAITGDIDPAKTKALVEKYFGTIPAGPPVPKITAVTPPITSERRSVVSDQVELPRVYMGWITPPIYKPGDAEADLLAQLLGGGKSSRLYKTLVYEKQIAQDVQVDNQSQLLGSIFEIQATAKPGVKPEDLERAIHDELAKLRSEGPTQAELERARNVIETRVIQALERLGGFGGVADRLNRYNHYLNDPGYLAKDIARYNNATVADLKRVANAALLPNARVVVYGVPGKKVIDDPPRTKEEQEKEAKQTSTVASTMPDEPWRRTAPQPGPLSQMSLPVPSTIKLSNGLTVLLVEEHKLPVVSAHLVVLTGSDANPVKKPGLASFTAAMLTEGTNRRSALEIADDAAQIGASIGSISTTDFSSASIRLLKQNVEPGLDLLSDIGLNPKFDPAEIERIRKQRQTDILQIKDQPVRLAFGALLKQVYGPDHPYGYREIGTAESNAAITGEDMLNFWKRGYVPGNSALVLAGDLTGEEARSLAEKYFGGWKGGTSRHAPPPVETKTSKMIYIVDKPAAPQTYVVAGGLAVPRSSPDYVPIEVMNKALGGLFSSRINMNLREEHGYTYGAFSLFFYRRGPGIFGAGGAIRTDATAPAVGEILKELERIHTAPLTADELKLAKDAFSLSLAGLFETSERTAGTIGTLFTYELPLDYYGQLPEKINAVNSADVQRVATEYIHPDSSIVIAVGDRAKIEPELKKLSIGPIETVDYDGNPVKDGAGSSK
ncbi:MAG: insulinase family protein [Acidobacteria bacterium]|nr:MAG: insulinase family protein [Acidobacteriota bacterium]